MSPFYKINSQYVNCLHIATMHIDSSLTVYCELRIQFCDGTRQSYSMQSKEEAQNTINEIVALTEALHSPQFFADAGTRFEPAGSPTGVAYVTPWAERVKKWAEDRNIIGGSTAAKQFSKLHEETRELWDHLVAAERDGSALDSDELRVAIADDIGKCVVVLRIIAALCNLDWETCLEQAWDDIKHRKGKLINGVFVKEQ